MIKQKLTKRAQRWLNNYCQTSNKVITIDNIVNQNETISKVYEKRKTTLEVKTNNGIKEIPNVELNVYIHNNGKTLIREFIQGYKFYKSDIIVYKALKFDEEGGKKIICSLWGYKPTKESGKVVQINTEHINQ